MMEQIWSKLEERYLQLMRQRRFGEAADFLREAYVEARQTMDIPTSGYISNLLAASLIASGRDEEALEAFRQAQQDDPSNAFLRLRIATLLLQNLKRPDEALDEIMPIAGELLGMNETRHASLGVLGACYASLGRIEDARNCFREMLQPQILTKMSSNSYDFYLVEALVARGEMPEECRSYLDLVGEKAARCEDEMTRKRVQALLRKLES